MRGFEARTFRFCCVSDLSILDENVVFFLKVRHIVYLLFAAFLIFMGGVQAVSLILAAVAVLAAFYPAKAVSFEAYVYGLFLKSIPYRKRIPVKIRKPEHPEVAGVDAQVSGITVERTDSEDEIEGLPRTRLAIEMLKKKKKEIS